MWSVQQRKGKRSMNNCTGCPSPSAGLAVYDGPIDIEVIRQGVLDAKHLEFAALQAPLKALLVEFGLRGRNAELLLSVVRHPLAVMLLGKLRPIALEGGPGLLAQGRAAAALGLLRIEVLAVGSRGGGCRHFGKRFWKL